MAGVVWQAVCDFEGFRMFRLVKRSISLVHDKCWWKINEPRHTLVKARLPAASSADNIPYLAVEKTEYQGDKESLKNNNRISGQQRIPEKQQ